MNRTAPPAQTAQTSSAFVISPAPTAPAAQGPAPAVTANWPVPPSQQTPAETPARSRRTAGGRGMPVGPVLAGAGNATALTLTTAYQYGGPVAAATTGALMAAGATGVALRRRAAVRRAASSRGASRGVLRGATGGGSRGAAKAGRTGSGGASRGALSGGRGALGGVARKTPRGALASMVGRTVAPRKVGATDSASDRGGAPGRGGRHERTAASGTGAGLLGGGKRRRGATAATASSAGRRTADSRHGGRSTGTATAEGTNRAARRSGTVKAALGRAARAAARGTSRVATAGWNATGPARAAAKQAALSAAKAAAAGLAHQVRRVPGALADGLLATGAGLLSGLWHRSWSAGSERLRDVWRKLRARRARKQAENTPEPTAEAAPTLAPVGDLVRRPASTTYAPTTVKGGPLMSGGHHFVAPAMEMARIAANYQPQGMLQVGEDFSGLSEALELHATAMKTTVENADASWPLDPTVVDLMRQIYGLQMKAAELARELRPAFEQLHGVDLDRLRNPRKGVQAEAMWDVRSNL